MDPVPDPEPSAVETGLRGRKKARRRQEILKNAEKLFARQGFDATTMAEIANETGVSPPTIFNYFGSKDNIIATLLFEGTESTRAEHSTRPVRTDAPFAEILGDWFCECTTNTLNIAGKRVWRYAEAANIRQANSDFQKQFTSSDAALLDLVANHLSHYDIVLRSRETPDPEFLAQLFFDRWTALYFDYIKDDKMPDDVHFQAIRSDIAKMTAILFDDAFAARSPLKKKVASA